MKNYRLVSAAIFMLLLVIVAFIWINSFAASGQSNAFSGKVAQTLKPILDPANHISQKDFNAFVRKAAHMFEFALLGGTLMSLTILHARKKERPVIQFLFAPLFFALSAAVMDEFIQSFTGRTSAVKDVLIDFAGSLIGVAVICGAYFFMTKNRRSHK